MKIGYSLNDDDCNDNVSWMNVGLTCSGSCTETIILYVDNDRDGYGSDEEVEVCLQTQTPAYLVGNNEDCDDTNPLMTLTCTFECTETVTLYKDSDLDGYGDPNHSIERCEDEDIPVGYTDNNEDCDDTNPLANTGSTIVECIECTEKVNYYRDLDGDEHGKGTSIERCKGSEKPTGYADNNNDCNDENSRIYQEPCKDCVPNNTNNPPNVNPRNGLLSREGFDKLKDELEGYRSMPYDDKTGKTITKWVKGATIGIGHLIYEEDWDTFKDGIDVDEGYNLFNADSHRFYDALATIQGGNLTQNQFDALFMFAFNIGDSGFENSSAKKFLDDCHDSNTYTSLENAMKAFNNGGVLDGRRNTEWEIFTNGY